MTKRRRRRGCIGVMAVFVVAVAWLVLAFGCGGHTIRPRGISFHYGAEGDLRDGTKSGFDFLRAPRCADLLGKGRRAPDCEAELEKESLPLDDGYVEVRYLGAGGVYVGWLDKAILFAPFFSNPPGPCTFFGDVRWDGKAIQCGLAGVPMERVGAIIAGHSHYDHIGDLPVVATNYAKGAALLVNCSGRNALEPYRDLLGHVRVLETMEGCSTRLRDADGPLPFRIRPIVSRHAPHLTKLVELWKGTTEARPDEWENNRRWSSLREGWTYNFVVDLTEDISADSRVRFRLFFQDSASLAPAGMPPPTPGDPPYDLAILGMASSQFVQPYPVDLLRRIKPRHVIGIHYENFTKPWGPRRKFAPLLTRSIAERFLSRVNDTLAEEHIAGTPPRYAPCGPSSDRWTMPLTGERLLFKASAEPPPPGAPPPGAPLPDAPVCIASRYANSGATEMKAECAAQGGE